ncbi:hypothetical protein Hanom_Chr03g00244791 [Helianthus anomalus]
MIRRRRFENEDVPLFVKLKVYGVVGWHDIIEAEHISLRDDCFFNGSKTNSRLLVTKLLLEEVLQ